jgi:hypothetical protein
MLDMPGPELSPATFVVLLENSKALERNGSNLDQQ